MKYIKYLIIYFLVLTSFGVYSQSQLGIYVGLNSGKLSGDSPSQFKYVSSTNVAFGVGYDFQLKEDIFLSTGVSYVNSSSKLKYPKEVDEKTVYEDSISLDFHLVSVPILLRLVSENKKFEFLGGFEMVFPTKFIADNSVEEVDIINEINKVTLSMLFGIGYRIPINKSLLIINLTYSQGISNLANNMDDPDSLLQRIRLTSFRLTAGWRLPVGRNKTKHSLAN